MKGIRTSLLTLYTIETIMTTCEVSNRDGRRCSRFMVYTVESFEDGNVSRLGCCSQHKPNAIRNVYDSQTHFGHNHRTRCVNDHINSIVTVERCEHILDEAVEIHHIGTIEFGPITEIEHLETLYDEYHEEYSLIGMYNLHNEDEDWSKKYNECKSRMRMIERRLFALAC